MLLETVLMFTYMEQNYSFMGMCIFLPSSAF